MDYLDWKNEFEKNVQMINANRFLETTKFGQYMTSKRNLLRRFAHQKDFIKMWLQDENHVIVDDIISPKLTKEYINQAIIKYMPLFDDTKIEREQFEFEEDGYTWYIRKDYLPPRGVLKPSEKDVEYYISAYNSKYTTTKKGSRSFFKFIYIDEPGYLNKTCLQYKTIQNTKYRIC